MRKYVLVINPGSTSTKIAVFDIESQEAVFNETIRHSAESLQSYPSVPDQKAFRTSLIINELEKHDIQLDQLISVVGRGGLLKPISGGTYRVSESMLDDLIHERYNSHASNLGAILAWDVARQAGIDAYIVDPVVVDEMDDIARVSGYKGIERRSVTHALNQKAVAREILSQLGKTYETSRVIVVHMGGGISLAAHLNGRMIDTVNGLDGEGPLTPERTGSLPLYPFAKHILDHQMDLRQVKKMLAGEGGLYSYLQETQMPEIIKEIEAGDTETALYVHALCYQVAKAIGEMAVVLKGQVDQIILTGGLAYNTYITDRIAESVDWISPVSVYPGEIEMLALFQGVERIIHQQEVAKEYT